MFVLYDSTYDGLLSACAWCFRNGVKPLAVLSESDPEPLLETERIPAESNIRRLFARHFTRVLGLVPGREVLETSFRAFLSEREGIASNILAFLRLALETGCDPSNRLYDREVVAVVEAAQRTGREAHAYTGLIRFSSSRAGLFITDCEPECFVLPLLMAHFSDRLPDQNFVIRDRRRCIAALHLADGTTSMHVLAGDQPDDFDSWSALAIPGEESAGPDDRDLFGPLWQQYLKRLSIPERRNPELQRSNMPKKYWRYLTEFQTIEKP